MSTATFWQRLYTQLVGIASCLISILVILYTDRFGFDFDVLFKIVYIAIGILAVYLGFWGSNYACKNFSLWHGLAFCIIGLFGWGFPNLGGLSLFTYPQSLMHVVVGVIGVSLGIASYTKRSHHLLTKTRSYY